MKKTADAHWEYIEALTRATMPAAGDTAVDFSVDELIALIGFHYKSAFTHGWKHALEALRAENTAQSSCCPEAAPCERDPRSAEGNLGAAVSAVSGAARRACDADNSVETIFKNDAEGKSPTEEEIAHVLTFLKEDR